MKNKKHMQSSGVDLHEIFFGDKKLAFSLRSFLRKFKKQDDATKHLWMERARGWLALEEKRERMANLFEARDRESMIFMLAASFWWAQEKRLVEKQRLNESLQAWQDEFDNY